MNWRKYVTEQAEAFGVPFEDAWMIFELLGPLEAYDAFPIELELLSEEGEREYITVLE